MKLFPFFISLSLLLSPLLLKAEILDSVVMVRAGNGQGTGFVAVEDGKHFLFTNTHVLMGGKPVICKTLSGTVIELGSLFVSNNRDLAKFEVNDFPGEGFTIASEMPEIHSEIQIFGNSDGAGVVTQLDGKILGIGPELVEVDAAFIPGNSGSPILTPEQNVIGVATFLTRYADEEDWTKKDSRFNEVRRYGVRLDNVEWIEMDLGAFHKRAALLADLSEMMDQIYNAFYTEKYMDQGKRELKYPMSSEGKKFISYPVFANDMHTYVTELNLAWSWIQTLNSGVDSHNSSRASQQDRRNAVRNVNMSYMMFNQKIEAYNLQCTTMRNKIRKLVAHDYWGTEYFKEKAASLYNVSNQLLKNIEKEE